MKSKDENMLRKKRKKKKEKRMVSKG